MQPRLCGAFVRRMNKNDFADARNSDKVESSILFRDEAGI